MRVLCFFLVSSLSFQSLAAPTKAEKRAGELTRGLYKAIRNHRWEQAASFMHPEMMEPFRFAVLQRVSNKEQAVKKKLLEDLRVADMNTLRTMDIRDFYVRFAASKIGKPARVFALPADVALEITKIDCKGDRCAVTHRLQGKDAKGKIDIALTLYVKKDAGFWTLSHLPSAGSSP